MPEAEVRLCCADPEHKLILSKTRTRDIETRLMDHLDDLSVSISTAYAELMPFLY